MNDNELFKHDARRRFDNARRQALRSQLAARLTGKDTYLLPFETIRRQLQQQSPIYQGLQDVPLEKIVGSVGRYHEFTRGFLPLNDSLKERWVTVTSLVLASKGWPPVDLYQIGTAYFVKDGNHRVSAARQLGLPHIEAYVWRFANELIVDPDDHLDDVLIRLEEQSFMMRTSLAERYSEYNIQFTSPGRYTELLAQIENLRATLALIDEQEIPYLEAVDSWYEMIYLPTVQIIHKTTLLADFPGRTDADLFAWLSLHRDKLQEQYGDYDNLADLAQILASKHKEGSITRLARQLKRLVGEDTLPSLEAPKE